MSEVSREKLEKVISVIAENKPSVSEDLWESLCERVNDAAKRIVSDLIEGEDSLERRIADEISTIVHACIESAKRDSGLLEIAPEEKVEYQPVLRSAITSNIPLGSSILDEHIVFATSLLERIFVEFIKASSEAGQGLVSDSEIDNCLSSGWSSFFYLSSSPEEEEEEQEKEQVQKFVLRAHAPQMQGSVSKLVKVDSSMTIKDVSDLIKKKMLRSQSTEGQTFCLFWVDLDNEESEGQFLEDSKTLSDYPMIRNDSTVELLSCESTISVHISEKLSKTYLVDVRSPVEKIIKYIVTDIGFREHSRFGLILLGNDGDGESPVLAKLRNSKSYDVLSVKKDLLESPGSPSLVKKTSLKKVKRPVSVVFVKEVSGTVKNKTSARVAPGTSPGSSISQQPIQQSVSSAAATSGQGDVTIVQTKDRSEWLKTNLTMKEQGIDEEDFLLLVRQEKILGFYDKLAEDPLGLCNSFGEAAENILKQLEALDLQIETIKSFSAGALTSGEIFTAIVDHIGEKGELTFHVDDKIEVFHQDGEIWYGRVVGKGEEGYFKKTAIKATKKTTPEGPKPRVKGQESLADSPVLMQGFLMKKGRNFDHWKKKYYVLRNNRMWYYKNSPDEKAVGDFSVFNCQAKAIPGFKKKNFVFSIETDGIERLMAAPTEDEMKKWVEHLKS